MPSLLYPKIFPFCPIAGDPSATSPFGGLYYPFPMTLRASMEIYWRVKTWTLNVYNPASSFSKSVVVGTPATSEIEIPCISTFVQTNFVSSDPDFDPGSGEDGFGFAVFDTDLATPSPYQGPLIYSNADYYPAVWIFWGADYFLSGEFGWAIDFNEATLEFSAENFDGGTLSLTPFSWWSYGGKYNEQTGL